MQIAAIEEHLIVARASEDDVQKEKAAVTIGDGLYILMDDTTEGISYSGSAWWTAKQDERWVNGTETLFAEGVSEGAGEIELLADGVQISFVGRAPPASAGHKLRAEINHGAAVNTELQDAPPTTSNTSSSSYRTWLTIDLPTGAREPHFVHVKDIPAGTSLDYAVVKVNPDAPVSGKLAIVDEMHKSVTYDGWERRVGSVVGADGEVYFPYGGSVHEAGDVGGSMDVVFVGTSINVYGIFTAANGTLSASYTIDSGSAQSVTYSPSSKTNLPNSLLFTQSDLSPGMHILTLTITENTSNQSLAVDYMTYRPSFTSVNALLSSSSGSSAGGERAKPRMSKGALAGMIVGVVLAVVVLIGLVCARQACVRWAKGAFTMRRWGRKAKGDKLGDNLEKGASPRSDPWSSQSPHYAFNVPGRNGSDALNTISSSEYASASVEKLEMKDIHSPPPPSPHIVGIAR